MTFRKNLSGERFGRLVALEIAFSEKNKKTKWLCECDCGNQKVIKIDSLTSGKTISCGCYRKEVTSMKFKKHGLSKHRIYTAWLNIKARIYNEKSDSYKYYGGRGVTICEKWLNFDDFYSWSIENGYNENLTIDRIDTNGNYEPSNCRWTTHAEQMNNTTRNVFVEIDGTSKTLASHARDNGVESSMLYKRYYSGLRGKDLIVPTKRNRSNYEEKGKQI